MVVPTAELAQQVAAVASRLAAGLPSAPCVLRLPAAASTEVAAAEEGAALLLVSTAEELEAALERGRLCASRLQIVAIDEVDAVCCAPHPATPEAEAAAATRATRLLALLRPSGSAPPRFLLSTAHLSEPHELALARHAARCGRGGGGARGRRR